MAFLPSPFLLHSLLSFLICIDLCFASSSSAAAAAAAQKVCIPFSYFSSFYLLLSQNWLLCLLLSCKPTREMRWHWHGQAVTFYCFLIAEPGWLAALKCVALFLFLFLFYCHCHQSKQSELEIQATQAAILKAREFDDSLLCDTGKLLLFILHFAQSDSVCHIFCVNSFIFLDTGLTSASLNVKAVVVLPTQPKIMRSRSLETRARDSVTEFASVMQKMRMRQSTVESKTGKWDANSI